MFQEMTQMPRDEASIRENVFGKSLANVRLQDIDESVTRPTTASARKSVIWSRERRMYEAVNSEKTKEFRMRPYNFYQYPNLQKHYPGTWKVVDRPELNSIVDRLTRPTISSSLRSRSAPVLHRRVCHSSTQT